MVPDEKNRTNLRNRAAWWDKKWGRDKMCGITHNRLRSGTDKKGHPYVTWIGCGHGFNTNALIKWTMHCLSKSDFATCPICRKKIII